VKAHGWEVILAGVRPPVWKRGRAPPPAGLTTIYGHMSVIIAREGESVRQGQTIEGSAAPGGRPVPSHFEMRHQEKPSTLAAFAMTIEQLLENAAKKK